MVSAKSAEIRLQHILYEINEITGITQDLSARQIMESYLHLRAAERAIQIISEAAKELPADLLTSEPEIPWKQIIGIGNFLRHEYYKINITDVQSILEKHLPVLREAILRMIDRMAAEK